MHGGKEHADQDTGLQRRLVKPSLSGLELLLAAQRAADPASRKQIAAMGSLPFMRAEECD